jgi:transposase
MHLKWRSRVPTQGHLPAPPQGAEEINPVVAILREQGEVAYFASGVPVFVHGESDAVGRRVAAAQLIELGLAHQDEISAALGIHRSTLYRQRRKLARQGVLGVVDAKRGPHGPHRLTPEKRERVVHLLAQGRSIRQAAREVGVTEGAIRHARRRGEVPSPEKKPTPWLEGPRARSEQDAQSPAGIAVKRHEERALAAKGELTEAAPRFVAAEAVRYGGALLALPALLAVGLLEAGEQTYGTLKNAFYGLRAILLILAFMALLRIRTPEQLQEHPPGELGILLGLDRAPEVKTLRRKLGELAARQQATEFSRRLAEHWLQEQSEAVGFLYIDGHVRAYHGHAHTLPEAWVARRRLCQAATTDFWVNQPDSQPLFVVTAPANDDLRAMLRREILPEIRRLVGERRVTVVFDREGWSPKFFREIHELGFDLLTYRQGKYPAWPRRAFRTVSGVVEGRAVSYQLAERSVQLLPGFRMREVRRLTARGHQTAILTTRDDLPIEVVAYRMFDRWRQENFFRYMRQHFALDALVSYAVESADPERTIPNPARKPVAKALAATRAALKELEQEYGQQARMNTEAKRRTMRGFKIAHAALNRRIAALQEKCRRLMARLKALPPRVPIKAVRPEAEIVRLEPETKHLSDTLKMICYRAETGLLRCLAPHYARNEEEGRALIREMLLTSADLVPEPNDHRLRICLHSLANPRSNEAMVKLCETLNELHTQYPGTDLTLVYQAPAVAGIVTPCQES